MASGEVPEPLDYKRYVLKVPINCEGCKKKVKRILRNIEGVYDIKIDAQQQRVVVTGNVDAEGLIKKLQKSGKNAELWPEITKPSNPIPNPNPNPKSKSKNKAAVIGDEKPPDVADNTSAEPATKQVNAAKTSAKAEAPTQESKNASSSTPNPASSPDSSEKPGTGGKKKGKKPQKDGGVCAESADGEVTAENATAASDSNASGGKKKGKKPQKDGGNCAESADGEVIAENATAASDSKASGGKNKGKKAHGSGGGGCREAAGEEVAAAENAANRGSPPPELLAHHPPQPVYAYSMAQPRMSYSYYTPPPPAYQPQQQQPDYYYTAYQQQQPPPPAYYSPYSAYPPPEWPSSSAPTEPYDMLSDENPNSCGVM